MEYFRNQIKLRMNDTNDPDEAEIVLSNKGGPKLIDNGFMYTMHKKQTNNIRWRCVLRSSQCRGSLVTSTDFKLPRVRMEHNHGPDYTAARLARIRYMALGQPPVLQEGDGIGEYENDLMIDPDKIKEEPPEVDPEEPGTSCQRNVPVFRVRRLNNGRNIGKRWNTVMQSGAQGTSGGRTIRIGTQSLVRQPLRNIAPAPTIQHRQQQQQQHPKTLVLKTIPLKVKHVAPTTIKMAPRQSNVTVPQAIVPQQSTEVCLRWNSYHSNMQNSFPSLLDSEQFVDVTLACEGRSLKCHKMILSSCSDYLASLLRENPCQHPIILMKDLKFWEVEALVKFMYRGEVNVAHDKLPQLLNAAEALQIKGLAGPSPSLQSPKPPKLVPRSKPLNPTSVLASPRVVQEAKESRKASVSSGAVSRPTAMSESPKRVEKRQASEPPQPRIFTKIRLQRPVTPTSPNVTVKLEPLDIPLSPTEMFPEHHRDEDISSTASNFDNLVMALHEEDDPGGEEDRFSTDGDMNFNEIPGRSDDINEENDEQMEFVPTDFLDQEQDIVEEADGEFSKSENEESDVEEEEDLEEETVETLARDGKNSNDDDRGNDGRKENCTNSEETL